MIAIEKTDFPAWIQHLSEQYTVMAPTGQGRDSAFRPVETAEAINTSLKNTAASPKPVFLPQTEVLFSYKDGKMVVPDRSEKPFFLWGVRACDARGVRLIDNVFGKSKQRPGDPAFEDPYWKAKFDSAVILTLACNEPAATCFCHWTGGHPFAEEGDLWAVELDDAFFVKVLSEKGEAVLDDCKAGRPASDEETARIGSLRDRAQAQMGEPVDLAEMKALLKELDDPELWDVIAAKCINCAACAFACPTCHCFDVQDEGKKGQGKRIRLWDACMHTLFTKEASGHNPRDLSRERVRQRFLHKFSYYWDNYGESLCTGCGRCITVCPVNLDIRQVIHTVMAQRKTA